eukprot:1808014-Prymnesium_polylepis.1
MGTSHGGCVSCGWRTSWTAARGATTATSETQWPGCTSCAHHSDRIGAWDHIAEVAASSPTLLLSARAIRSTL